MFGGRIHVHVLDEQKIDDLYLIDFLTMVQSFGLGFVLLTMVW